jgi:DNA-binding response OmpR family regulator
MMNALVLDDEPRYREHVKRALEKRGLRIHAVGSADEARSVVQDLGVDLMIVDIRLGGDTNGLDFAAWAQAHHGNPAVIVITGYGSPEHESRSRELGAAAYLEKPFSMHDLAGHVQRIVDQRAVLREVHKLEQQLAAAQKQVRAQRELASLAMVSVAADGAVLHANQRGAEVLATVVDPALPRPVARLDDDLCARLFRAVGTPDRWHQSITFARDGTLRHFATFTLCGGGGAEDLLAVFFETAQASGGVDELWMGILARTLGGGCSEA